MRILNTCKKIFVLAVAAASVSIVSVNSSSAAPEGNYLQQIASNTYNILTKVNALPVMLQSLTTMGLSMIAKDDSDETANIQQDFSKLGSALIYQTVAQKAYQQQLMADILGVQVSQFTSPAQSPKILDDLPYVNDLSFATLLNSAPAPAGGKTPFNYIRYISGTTISHPVPTSTWQGKEKDIKSYTDYFKVVTSIQSYNSYLLSSLIVESLNPITPTEDKLMQQASNSDWIADIATQEIGKVLRQILMYESQNYVLNVSLRKAMQQMVAAQAMSNSLLIINNRSYENELVRKAKGLPASSSI